MNNIKKNHEETYVKLYIRNTIIFFCKGHYKTEIKAVTNFTKVSLYAYSGLRVLQNNVTFSGSFNMAFQVPEGLII